jgi:micrococcal nuclease
MKRYRLRAFSSPFLIFLIVAFLALRSGQIRKQQTEPPFLKGEVIAVLDGDTIKVRLQGGGIKTVRLLGIDTPELSDPRDDVRWLASVAKRYTFWKLYRKKVELRFDLNREDKHGRILAYIWTEKNLFNAMILRDGFASAFLKFPFKHRKEFKDTEEEARMQKRGFWREESYPMITTSEAQSHLGMLMDVRFLCSEVEIRGKYCFFRASGGEFLALLPKKELSQFPDVRCFEGKRMSVTGLLEEYKERPQIMIFFPWQIKIVS